MDLNSPYPPPAYPKHHPRCTLQFARGPRDAHCSCGYSRHARKAREAATRKTLSERLSPHAPAFVAGSLAATVVSVIAKLVIG